MGVKEFVMGSATVTSNAAGLDSVGRAQSGTRYLATAGGETRSQFFQRLRSECVWDAAELLKEQVRAECRNRGETKRQAGICAWNAIAKTYPKPDAATWNEFTSRSHRPPGISTATDVTKESAELAGAWVGSMQLLGSLATRCPEVARFMADATTTSRNHVCVDLPPERRKCVDRP